MSNRPWLRFSFGFGCVSVLCASALAQTQGELVTRVQAVTASICGSAGNDAGFVAANCAIAGPGQQAQNALTISPREQNAAGSTATQTTDTQISAEADRLEQARREGSDTEQRLGGFLNGSGGFGTVDDHGEADDYDVWGGGVQTGIDYRLSDALVAGFGIGWNRQNTEFDTQAAVNGAPFEIGGGKIESDAYTPSLYASFFSGPFHVDGIVSYTYLDYEFERPVVLLDIGDDIFATAEGDTEAHQVGASLNFGYEFQLGGLSTGPLAGVEYRQTWIDGYREDGVPNFPLDYDEQDILSLVSSLGGEASYAISTGFGVIAPHARITWEHEFENDARDIDARLFLNVDPDAADVLTSRTRSPDRDYARVGAGVSAQFAQGISAFLDYDTVLALSDVEHHRFTAGGRIAF